MELANKHEDEWSKFQGKLHDSKINEKTKKAHNQSLHTLKLLKQHKLWKRPAISAAKLKEILQIIGDISEKIVETEVSYYRNTHKSEVMLQHDLFKVYKTSHEEGLVNLGIFLGQENNSN